MHTVIKFEIGCQDQNKLIYMLMQKHHLFDFANAVKYVEEIVATAGYNISRISYSEHPVNTGTFCSHPDLGIFAFIANL